jgi:hypothetical protein
VDECKPLLLDGLNVAAADMGTLEDTEGVDCTGITAGLVTAVS